MKKALKIFLYSFSLILIIILLLFAYFNFPVKTSNKDIELGVTFSARYAHDIGLDPKETLKNIFDDLKVKRIRIPVYWDQAEPEKDKYDFSEIEWQLAEAERAQARVILVIGQKVPRWPECFIPEWVGDDKNNRYRQLVEFLQIVVEKYRENKTIAYWQVENEPFLNFGICPPIDSFLLDLEIAAVRAKDSSRPIIVTDSGELSLWIPAAKRADIFGTTLYRSVVTDRFGGIAMDYPIGPNFFKFKRWLTEKFTKQKNIFICELQGEPWLDGWTTDQPLEKQFESMNVEKLRENIEFAKKTEMNPVYLWGVEWWYWLKVKKNQPQLWEEAKILFGGKSLI